MTRLYQDHMRLSDGIQHKRVYQLAELDHRPEYQDTRIVASESSDHAYLVGKVECLQSPFDPDETDLVEDTITVIVCGCDSHWYRCSGGFEDGENPPNAWNRCKHATVFREERARQDDSQQSLDDTK